MAAMMCLPGRSALLCLLLGVSVPALWASTTRTDDRIYYVSEETANQTAAREICRRHGYNDLAILDTPEKQEMAELAIKVYNRTRRVGDVWLGVHSPSMNGVYTWLDNGPITWSNWDNVTDDEPDETSTQGCVRMKVEMDFRWATKQCHSSYSSLCERNKSSWRSVSMEVVARGSGVEGPAYWTGTERSQWRCFLRCGAMEYRCLLVYFSNSTCTIYSTYQVVITPGRVPGSVLASTLPDRV